ITRVRLERLADERDKTGEKIEDMLKMAEDEERDLADVEQPQLTKHRERYAELEEEIVLLSADIERTEASRDVSKLLRTDDDVVIQGDKRFATARTDDNFAVYSTLGEVPCHQLIVHVKFGPTILSQMGGDGRAIREQA